MSTRPSSYLMQAAALLFLFTSSIHAAPLVLQNSELVFRYDPAIGRITEFRSVNGKNWMLSEHPSFNIPKRRATDYVARGGERLGLTPPLLWRFVAEDPLQPGRYNFLPDETIDGKPWRVVRATPTSLTVESSKSDWLGIIVTRRFTLLAEPAALEIRTDLRRVSASPISIQVWSISAIRSPNLFWMGIDPAWQKSSMAWTELSRPGRLPGGSVERTDSAIQFTLPAKPDHPKVGSMGSWIAAVDTTSIFLQTVEFDPAGCYPDNSSVQAYGANGFAEIETISPNVFLKVGETFTSHVRWTILSRNADASAENLSRRAQQLWSASAPSPNASSK